MFTGIVQTQAQLIRRQSHDQLQQLTFAVAPTFLQGIAHGASIAINGCCLTVVAFEHAAEAPAVVNDAVARSWVRFDVIDETLRLTNLADVGIGAMVNFERSLKVGDELGGHQVSGHIHGKAPILAIERTSTNCAIAIALPPAMQPYVFSKGFIAIDGASLTVGAVDGAQFWLHLIPETLQITTLGQRQVGDLVNIELEQQTMTIVDTVRRTLAAMSSSVPTATTSALSQAAAQPW
jgi:riboflavin synthase